MSKTAKKVFILLFLCTGVCARIHKLRVEDDYRSKIDLTTFGFVLGGKLAVNITNFHFELEHPTDDAPSTKEYLFGFSLGKSSNDNLQDRGETCILEEYKDVEKEENGKKNKQGNGRSLILFIMDFSTQAPCIHLVRMGEDLQHLNISVPPKRSMQAAMNSPQGRRKRRSLDFLSDSYLFPHVRSKRELDEDNDAELLTSTPNIPFTTTMQAAQSSNADDASGKLPEAASPVETTANKSVSEGPVQKENKTEEPDQKPESTRPSFLVTDTIPLTKDPLTERYSTYFVVDILTPEEEGLYNLFFHNCDNYNKKSSNIHKAINFTIHLSESNYGGSNYLSAGEIPLPLINMVLCAIYFVLVIVWWMVIRKATDGVFKTHYMMLVFLCVKCVSLFFHSINFHFIQKEGHHEAAFAILYYITYLMKGTLLFVTIVLVGAGWAFVKHILSKRDKKIFIIVIPLQILANVAQIIIEETEEGQSQYLVWKQLFIMLDLLCCGAILFPVIWSIRHLQDASQTDGKAAINLCKLKIFRHFYIMIVCYIYFTRIIVYLLAMTLPFQFTWMCTVFKEAAALVFFVVTGYKFRPASNNPYLQIPQSDDEVEMDQVLTESGVTEGLTRVNIKDPGTSTVTTTKQRESSHEYD